MIRTVRTLHLNLWSPACFSLRVVVHEFLTQNKVENNEIRQGEKGIYSIQEGYKHSMLIIGEVRDGEGTRETKKAPCLPTMEYILSL